MAELSDPRPPELEKWFKARWVKNQKNGMIILFWKVSTRWIQKYNFHAASLKTDRDTTQFVIFCILKTFEILQLFEYLTDFGGSHL